MSPDAGCSWMLMMQYFSVKLQLRYEFSVFEVNGDPTQARAPAYTTDEPYLSRLIGWYMNNV